MAGESKTTTDHDKIKQWIEARGGRPVHVQGTGDADDAGILRVDFGEKEERLEEIPWDDFFNKFEESQLAFLYQDEMSDGSESRFFKFVSRNA